MRPTYRFSQVSQRTPESPISFFMQQAIENPNIISLAAGMVDSDSLPVQEVAGAVSAILSAPTRAKVALQYGTTQGYGPLRQKLARHVAELDGRMNYSPANVVVTTGSQQLLYTLSELMLDAGDIVITEAPSYFVYQSVLSARGVEVVGVPMDDDGMIVSELENRLLQLEAGNRLAQVKLLYTVDYYQNPSGRTLSLARRHELIELLRCWESKVHIPVLEDAAYRELRFDGPNLPSLKSLDTDDRFAIYAGTFSKPCSPGLKTGYAILPPELVEPLLLIKGNHDFGSANLAQHILDELLANGKYASHVVELQTAYRIKRDAILGAIRDCFAGEPGVSWTEPAGGMFVWLKLPDSISTGMRSDFARAAIAEGVLYVPGIFAYRGAGPLPDCEMRLAFGDATPEKLREGVLRLRRAYDRVKIKAELVYPTQASTALNPGGMTAVNRGLSASDTSETAKI